MKVTFLDTEDNYCIIRNKLIRALEGGRFSWKSILIRVCFYVEHSDSIVACIYDFKNVYNLFPYSPTNSFYYTIDKFEFAGEKKGLIKIDKPTDSLKDLMKNEPKMVLEMLKVKYL